MSDLIDATPIDAQSETEFFKVTDNQDGTERRIAYKKSSGQNSPGILFIAGFMSCKDANKPTALHSFCQKQGIPFVRFDATALGETEGPIELKDARFSHWLQDAEEVLVHLTEGPQLVIGSSMGGWIASCLAKRYPEKICGLLLLAPSINFSQYYVQRLRKNAPPELLEVLEKGESFEYNDPKYGPYPLSLRVFQEMVPYELPLEEDGGYPVQCPVRIIHGTEDTYSPYMNSLKLLTGFETKDVQLTYIKGTGHHLDDPDSLEMIYKTILNMMSILQSKL